MGTLKKDTFICFDLETTGLLPKEDRVIEFAAKRFTFEKEIDSFELLIDPEVTIPDETIAIHNITREMVEGKPKIKEVLEEILTFIGDLPIVGHGIGLDVEFLVEECKRHNISCSLEKNITIDTLRLARLYGKCPKNSLQAIRQHFGIEEEKAHRAMGDVVVNIKVFKALTDGYRTTEELLNRLKLPILMSHMPFGQHKGRDFSEVPRNYLQYLAKGKFDVDLTYTIRHYLKKSKNGGNSFFDGLSLD